MKRVNQILTLGFWLKSWAVKLIHGFLYSLWGFWYTEKTFLSKLSWSVTLQNNEVLSNLSLRTPQCGHPSITYSLFGTRNTKNHTFPSSIIRTPQSVKRTLGSVPLLSVLKRFDCLNHSTSFISKIAWWILSTFSLVQSVCPLVLMARRTSDCFEASSSPVLFVFPLPLNSPHPPRLNPQHPPPCLNKKYTERRNWSNLYKKIILNLWKKFSAV